MYKRIRRILQIAGQKKSALMAAVWFNILKAFCAGGTYITLLFALTDLISGSFESRKLLFYSGIFAALLVLKYVFEYVVNSLQSSAGYEMICDLRMKETRRLTTFPLGDFQREGAGKLTSVFTNDMSFVEMYCISTVSGFVAGLTVWICTSVVMLIADFRLALCAMAGFIPAFLVYRDSRKKFARYGKRRQSESQNCIGSMLQYLAGMETIRSYQMTERIFHEMDEGLRGYKEASADYELKVQVPMMWFQLFVRLGMALIFVCGLLFYFAGMTPLSIFLFFAVISSSYYQPAESLLLDFGTLNLIDISLDHIQELHDKKPLSDRGNKRASSHELRAEQVSFAYEGKAEDAVQDVSAIIPEHAFTALVGPSGSGKTTLLLLLARFWDLRKGSVKLGETDVKNIPYKELLKHFSFVFQEVYLFSGTVMDNIRMGRPDASREDIVAAAKAACCHDFITEMPEGYDTWIGSGGSTLSGGEKQRISIARAILKDAPIILMDEALSGIDPENALEIQRGLDRLTKGKTVVMIAHTLSHIRFADQILVMEDGKIAEAGTHDDLLTKEGLYMELWEKEHGMKRWKLHV
ncbi:MAG: ABC transporter ATP-binding protein [Peptostreptococcaceae bacterium]|nr:ABC transporter ATP-binding protein [Peptostreptococcaceae bacterium]